MCKIKLKLDFLSTLVLLYMLNILSESNKYKGIQNEKSKLPLKYMTGYFCRSVYKDVCLGQNINFSPSESSTVLPAKSDSDVVFVYKFIRDS